MTMSRMFMILSIAVRCTRKYGAFPYRPLPSITSLIRRKTVSRAYDAVFRQPAGSGSAGAPASTAIGSGLRSAADLVGALAEQRVIVIAGDTKRGGAEGFSVLG